MAAICVLASNRLLAMALQSNTVMFCCNESTVSCRKVVVVCGERDKASSKKKGGFFLVCLRFSPGF